jgi:hypothetical protein
MPPLTMSLSPRLRADYLLLGTPTAQRCLEAFATVEGADLYATYPNIVRKAATIFSELPALIDAALPPELMAIQVGRFLDGGYEALISPETHSIDGLLAD